MGTLPYYPFWWTDYSGDTFSLTQGQHGAYFLLLRHIYAEGRDIPHADRFSIARAMLEQEQSNTDFVLQRYFKRNGSVWTHKRATEIIAKANESHQKRVKAGGFGGKKKSSNARAMLEQPSSNQNQNQNQIDVLLEKEPKDVRSTKQNFDTEFEEFWQGWNPYDMAKGHKQPAKLKYEKSRKEGIDHATIITGRDRYLEHCHATQCRTQHAATWISQRGWEGDWTAQAGRNAGKATGAHNGSGSGSGTIADQLERLKSKHAPSTVTGKAKAEAAEGGRIGSITGSGDPQLMLENPETVRDQRQ